MITREIKQYSIFIRAKKVIAVIVITSFLFSLVPAPAAGAIGDRAWKLREIAVPERSGAGSAVRLGQELQPVKTGHTAAASGLEDHPVYKVLRQAFASAEEGEYSEGQLLSAIEQEARDAGMDPVSYLNDSFDKHIPTPEEIDKIREENPPDVIIEGGGSGCAFMTRVLKEMHLRGYYVVSVFDDGSASGEMRNRKYFPPGDTGSVLSGLAHKSIRAVTQARVAYGTPENEPAVEQVIKTLVDVLNNQTGDYNLYLATQNTGVKPIAFMRDLAVLARTIKDKSQDNVLGADGLALAGQTFQNLIVQGCFDIAGARADENGMFDPERMKVGIYLAERLMQIPPSLGHVIPVSTGPLRMDTNRLFAIYEDHLPPAWAAHIKDRRFVRDIYWKGKKRTMVIGEANYGEAETVHDSRIILWGILEGNQYKRIILNNESPEDVLADPMPEEYRSKANPEIKWAFEHVKQGVFVAPGSSGTSVWPAVSTPEVMEGNIAVKGKGLSVTFIASPSYTNEDVHSKSLEDLFDVYTDSISRRIGRHIPPEDWITDIVYNDTKATHPKVLIALEGKQVKSGGQVVYSPKNRGPLIVTENDISLLGGIGIGLHTRGLAGLSSYVQTGAGVTEHAKRPSYMTVGVARVLHEVLESTADGKIEAGAAGVRVAAATGQTLAETLKKINAEYPPQDRISNLGLIDFDKLRRQPHPNIAVSLIAGENKRFQKSLAAQIIRDNDLEKKFQDKLKEYRQVDAGLSEEDARVKFVKEETSYTLPSKVIYPFLGRPLAQGPLEAAKTHTGIPPIAIVGFQAPEVMDALGAQNYVYIQQPTVEGIYGTGYASSLIGGYIPPDYNGLVTIAVGDAPLINEQVFEALENRYSELVAEHGKNNVAGVVAASTVAFPERTRYGRLIIREDGTLDHIIETNQIYTLIRRGAVKPGAEAGLTQQLTNYAMFDMLKSAGLIYTKEEMIKRAIESSGIQKAARSLKGKFTVTPDGRTCIVLPAKREYSMVSFHLGGLLSLMGLYRVSYDGTLLTGEDLLYNSRFNPAVYLLRYQDFKKYIGEINNISGEYVATDLFMRLNRDRKRNAIVGIAEVDSTLVQGVDTIEALSTLEDLVKQSQTESKATGHAIVTDLEGLEDKVAEYLRNNSVDKDRPLVIYLDLDKILSANSSGPIKLDVAAALAKTMNLDNVYIAILTQRSFNSVKRRVLEPLSKQGIDIDDSDHLKPHPKLWCLAYGGMDLFEDRKPSVTLNEIEAIALSIKQHLSNKGILIDAIISVKEDDQNNSYKLSEDKNTILMIEGVGVTVALYRTFLKEQPDSEINMKLCEDLIDYVGSLPHLLGSFLNSSVSGRASVDIRVVNKGEAQDELIKRLAKELGISAANISRIVIDDEYKRHYAGRPNLIRALRARRKARRTGMAISIEADRDSLKSAKQEAPRGCIVVFSDGSSTVVTVFEAVTASLSAATGQLKKGVHWAEVEAMAAGFEPGTLIGTDGMRGTVMTHTEAVAQLGSEKSDAQFVIDNAILTYEMAYVFGQGLIMTLGTKMDFLLGGDPRPSTAGLMKEVARGIKSMGGNVQIITKPISTPALAYESREKGCVGVSVSGSHLLSKENGLKPFLDGKKLSDETTLELERNAYDIAKGTFVPETKNNGAIAMLEDEYAAHGAYRDFVVNIFEKEFGLNPLGGKTVVLDGANGAVYAIADAIFKLLGAEEVHWINNSQDGNLINVQSDGSTNETGKPILSGSQNTSRLHDEVMKLKLQGKDAVGFAFDGDADRLMGIDENGKLMDGDVLLGGVAMCLKDKGKLKNNTVVGTTMSTLGLIRALEAADINLKLAKVGDRFVLEEMQKTGAVAGGEQSGHIILTDYQTTGDGIITVLVLLCNAAKKSVPVSALTTDKIKTDYPYLGPHQDIGADSADVANKLMAELNEDTRYENEFYRDILEIIEECFINTGLAHYYSISLSQDSYVKPEELYIRLWGSNDESVGWVSVRQSGTEPKKIRIYLTADCDEQVLGDIRKQFVNLVGNELERISSGITHAEAIGKSTGNLAQLKQDAIDKFKQEFGHEPEGVIWVPSRICIDGEHIDYVKYLQARVLTFASAERGMFVAYASRKDGKVRSASTHPDFSMQQFDLGDAPVGEDWLEYLTEKGIPQKSWTNYIQGSFFYLQNKNALHGLRGADIAVSSNIPVAGGASSSSALVVAGGLVARLVNEIHVNLNELADDSSKAEWFVGTRGGKMDQATISLGQEGKALSMRFEPFSVTPVDMPAGYEFVTFFTTTHEGGSQITSEYNERSAISRFVIPAILEEKVASLPDLKAKWEAFKKAIEDNDLAAIDALKSDIEDVINLLPEKLTLEQIETDYKGAYDEIAKEEKGAYAALFGVKGKQTALKVQDRCRHHIGEIVRVIKIEKLLAEAAQAQREGNQPGCDAKMQEVGELISGTHASLRYYYDTSTPEVEEVVNIVNSVDGVLGNRMMGGGFGGNVLVLVKKEAAPSVIEAVEAGYYEPQSRDTEGFINPHTPGRGASREFAMAAANGITAEQEQAIQAKTAKGYALVVEPDEIKRVDIVLNLKQEFQFMDILEAVDIAGAQAEVNRIREAGGTIVIVVNNTGKDLAANIIDSIGETVVVTVPKPSKAAEVVRQSI